MSSDNGIYILSTIRTRKYVKGERFDHWETVESPYVVYRVAEMSAIDNFDWYEKNQNYNLGAYMKSVWGSSPVYETEEEALSAANELEKSLPLCEYGISHIRTQYIFYGDM
jgi:hypothetical protein